MTLMLLEVLHFICNVCGHHLLSDISSTVRYILTLLQLLHVPGLLYSYHIRQYHLLVYISILGNTTTYIPCYMYYIPVELLASEREGLQAWWAWLTSSTMTP